MLIATSLVAVLAASALAAPADPAPSPATAAAPPIMIAVTVSADISQTLVNRVLAEADAIWRASGITFVWQPAPREVLPYARTGAWGAPASYGLRVVIGNDRGAARDQRTPLGWIVFDDGAPRPEIYVSHANAWALMESARAVVGMVPLMPPVQREVLLARAMGRALAHELAHYLLASKVHTVSGLLQASRTSAELFATDRRGFALDAAQRQQVAARLRGEPLVARR
jgi:hypothetical protein